MVAPADRPVMRSAPRRWTKTRQKKFLAELARSLNVAESARQVGMTAASAYDRKRRDTSFAEAWREALDRGYGDLELALLRQAVQGCERTETVHDAKDGSVRQIKTVRSYPQAMAVRLLLAHRAEVAAYRQAKDPSDDTEDTVLARVRAEMMALRERFGGVVIDDAEAIDTAGSPE